MPVFIPFIPIAAHTLRIGAISVLKHLATRKAKQIAVKKIVKQNLAKGNLKLKPKQSVLPFKNQVTPGKGSRAKIDKLFNKGQPPGYNWRNPNKLLKKKYRHLVIKK
jgi:hypothetical protein